MGADGGLQWMRLKKPWIFGQLTKHLVITDDSGQRDDHDDVINELRSRPGFWTFSTYGSWDPDDEVYLECIVKLVRDHLTKPEASKSDGPFMHPATHWLGDTTWRDLLMDVETMSSPWSSVDRHVIDSLLTQLRFSERVEYGDPHELLERVSADEFPALDMTLHEWALAVADAADLGTYGSRETWT